MKLFFVFCFSWLLLLFPACHKNNSPITITDANFSISGYEVSVPATITFINVSQNATSYSWDFGDGSTSNQANPTHTYTMGGTYLLKLTATGPTGQDAVCKQVDVEQVMGNHSAFSYFMDRCSGAPVNILLRSLHPGSTNYSWDFGNGATSLSNSPNIQYIQTGDFTVRFSSRINGVQDTVIRVIRIQ